MCFLPSGLIRVAAPFQVRGDKIWDLERVYGMRRIVKSLSFGTLLQRRWDRRPSLHNHATRHPSVKVSAWFLLSCLQRDPLWEGRVPLHWAAVSCGLACIYDKYNGECTLKHAYMDMHTGMQAAGQPIRPPAGPSTGLWWAVALIDHL